MKRPIGKRIEKRQKNVDKAHKPISSGVKKGQKRIKKTMKPLDKPSKRIERAGWKTKPAQDKLARADKYRPLKKEKGPFKQEDKWNLNKIGLLFIGIIMLVLLMVGIPCMVIFLILFILMAAFTGSIFGVVHIVKWVLQLIYAVGRHIMRFIEIGFGAVLRLLKKLPGLG